MNNAIADKILDILVEDIDIPDSNYEIAEKRYKALSEWFADDSSRCSAYDPHLYAQGSFRLGTIIRPLNADGEYDLDMGCRLRHGISKATHTQKQLKELVGADVESYRVAQGFKQLREEKNRCWRLKYSDQLNFHLDAVPSIPEDASRRSLIKEAMVKAGSAESLAQSVVALAGAITDRSLWNYTIISNDWLISNSEGYALWFESRMEQARLLLEKWASAARAAKIDKLPTNRRKSPLQKCIQLLKRHRDVMFDDDPDGKPISIIITTLAALAYEGETELDDALSGILTQIGTLVRPVAPRVPNPVNPAEDFADKWAKAEYSRLHLEQNFWRWLGQAKQDLEILQNTRTAKVIVEQVSAAFAVEFSEEVLKRIPGLAADTNATTLKGHTISTAPAKPWLER